MNEKIDKRFFAEAILDTRFWLLDFFAPCAVYDLVSSIPIQHRHAETAGSPQPAVFATVIDRRYRERNEVA